VFEYFWLQQILSFETMKTLMIFFNSALVLLLCIHADAMFSKKQRYYEEKVKDPERRFRSNVAELFLDNQVSADRIMSVFEDAKLAGTKHISDLCSKTKSKTKKKFRKNAQRDLLRRLLKKNQWPPVYVASIRIFDPKTQTIKWTDCPFLLPHEVIQVLFQLNDHQSLLSTEDMSATCLAHLQKQKDAFQLSSAIAVGLWVDGVPYNWDRSASLEVVSISFPGLANKNGAIRIPLVAFDRKYVAKDYTFDDVFEILAWSFSYLATGRHPCNRHDNSPFAEKKRRDSSNTPLLSAGFVCEFRGDWKMLAETIKIPAWNKKDKCCFKCNIKLEDIAECNSDAPWRQLQNRTTHWDFILNLMQNNIDIPSIFKIPGFTVDCIALDWLHAVDQGIGADMVGNLLWQLLAFQTGNNRAEQIKALWAKMQSYYAQHRVADPLHSLTETMLRKKASSSPKLRGGAAQIRALVNFVAEQSSSTFNDSVPEQQAAKMAAKHLKNCYNCLSRENYSQQVLQREATMLGMQYKALERHSLSEGTSMYKIKPKFHMFHELCMLPSNPACCWTYRDEDFGGYVAAVGRSRGGKRSVFSTGQLVLNKFRAKFDPCLKSE
jgi:hypothetical protein